MPPFDFNVYSALLLPAFIQGLLFAAILWLRGQREACLADRLLAFLLLIFSLRVANWMLGFAGWYDSHDGYTTFMFYFPFNHWFAIGPLVYFYFRSLTNSNFKFRGANWWHFAPAFAMIGQQLTVFVIDVLIKNQLMGQPFPEHFGTKGSLADWPTGLADYLLYLAAYGSLGYYFIRTRQVYRQYRHYLNANFSETSSLRFAWLNYCLYAVGAALVIWFAFDIVEFVRGKQLPYQLDWYSFFAWGIIIYYLSIAGYGAMPKQVLALHFEPDTTAHIGQKDAVTETENLRAYAAMLQQYMGKKRPYLQPELTLADLAGYLDMSPTVVSRVLNTQLNQNFNEFINAYRVEAVKRMAADPAFKHLSILGIAYECGFNSKATFNRAFLKHAGCSPSEFLKAQKKTEVSNS